MKKMLCISFRIKDNRHLKEKYENIQKDMHLQNELFFGGAYQNWVLVFFSCLKPS